MKKPYSIKEFDPITAEEQELFKLFELLDVTFREMEKDDPLPTNEFRLKNFRHKEPTFDDFWWLVWEDNKVRGFCILTIRNQSNVSYEENKHVAYVQIRIQKDHRRNGLGLKLVKKVIQKSKEIGVIAALQNTTAYESGYAFSEKLNGILAMESTTNRCRFANIDWNLMEEWKKQGQVRSKKDERSLKWFEKCPEDIIEEFCNVYTETMNQQPLGEIETRAIITPESRRITEQEFAKLGYIWHSVITREKNGAISGITDMTYIPDRPYRIEQELTGVKNEYRGKGLGKWLKSEMLHFIHKKYPNAKYISTGNADSNAAMLSINTRMGFKPHQQRKTYKFNLIEIEKRIAEIESKN
ncbi:MAG: GNAT family N-acetyltransferase [Candidatus Heimdallarchaeota archaeon]|nr:GNAT family N-acetyltransferase [Candidatus Heimdallarchaeota archaeon]MBY8994914.1 GNAT family N-acetyltransferase [Candidatus Heimdallarchaeota archaeon]